MRFTVKREQIKNLLNKINIKNINKGIDTFNEAVQDFGDSMDSITKEMSSDLEKLNREAETREKRNIKNLDKIWGEKIE